MLVPSNLESDDFSARGRGNRDFEEIDGDPEVVVGWNARLATLGHNPEALNRMIPTGARPKAAGLERPVEGD